MRKRLLSFVLSAVLLLMPVASVAEAAMSNYYAGELTATAIGDSYYGGNQLNVSAAFGLDADEALQQNQTVQAIAELLAKANLEMSFYDDFGTARIHAALTLGGAELLSGDMLVAEDGSVQIMSSLTGKLVLALPAGGMSSPTGGLSMADFDFDNDEQVAAFRALPAAQRLMISGNEMISLVINHLLGWVSFTQMETGELYAFDDTYLEATETRDPVAQRMVGKIEADSFNRLMWNVMTTISDTTGEFQLAIADLLAERGVTRYQARRFIDALFTEETIDPALDYVSTSYFIIENKDESPIVYDDVAYFFKKLQKSTGRIWDESTDNMLTLDVSYDDFGAMVGLDAYLPQFTKLLPYAGDFTYSIKTDDFWQRLHTAHGELQVRENQRVVGDLNMQFGEDVDGVNHSHFIGQADLLDQTNNTSMGVGVNANLDFEIAADETGAQSETFEAAALLSARVNGEDSAQLSATVSGMTTASEGSLSMNATAALGAAELGMLVTNVTLEQGEYEEISFAGGRAIDLTAMDAEQEAALMSEIQTQATKLALVVMSQPDVLENLMTIAEGLSR